MSTAGQGGDDIALVTGGTGFIGSHLCRRLCAEGMMVHGTSRQPQSLEAAGMRWWQGDMADPASARQIFAAVRPGIVFHLAGSVGAGPEMGLVLQTYHGLLTSTINVLLMAAEFGCRRVILAGSFTEPRPSLEPPTPGSPYGAAKWASSVYGRMFHSLYGTPVVI